MPTGIGCAAVRRRASADAGASASPSVLKPVPILHLMRWAVIAVAAVAVGAAAVPARALPLANRCLLIGGERLYAKPTALGSSMLFGTDAKLRRPDGTRTSTPGPDTEF